MLHGVFLVCLSLLCLKTWSQSISHYKISEYEYLDTIYSDSNVIDKILFYNEADTVFYMAKYKEGKLYEERNVNRLGEVVDSTHCFTYFENGNVSSEYKWRNLPGRGIGSVYGSRNFSNYESGELKSLTIEYGDTLESINFYKNGTISSIVKTDMINLLDYSKYVYNEEGFIEESVFSSFFNYNGLDLVHSLVVRYYLNGQVAEEYRKLGLNVYYDQYISYYANGKIKEKGAFYVNDDLDSAKDHNWQYFDENGKLLYEEIWDKGVLLSTTKPDTE